MEDYGGAWDPTKHYLQPALAKGASAQPMAWNQEEAQGRIQQFEALVKAASKQGVPAPLLTNATQFINYFKGIIVGLESHIDAEVASRLEKAVRVEEINWKHDYQKLKTEYDSKKGNYEWQEQQYRTIKEQHDALQTGSFVCNQIVKNVMYTPPTQHSLWET